MSDTDLITHFNKCFWLISSGMSLLSVQAFGEIHAGTTAHHKILTFQQKTVS